MTERWRSKATRDLVAVIRAAGGTVTRTRTGRLVVAGPKGTVTIQEPAGDSRRDLRRSSARKLIHNNTGLEI